MDRYVRKELVELAKEVQNTGWRIGSKENDISDLETLSRIMRNERKILKNLIKIAKLSNE